MQPVVWIESCLDKVGSSDSCWRSATGGGTASRLRSALPSWMFCWISPWDVPMVTLTLSTQAWRSGSVRGSQFSLRTSSIRRFGVYCLSR